MVARYWFGTKKIGTLKVKEEKKEPKEKKEKTEKKEKKPEKTSSRRSETSEKKSDPKSPRKSPSSRKEKGPEKKEKKLRESPAGWNSQDAGLAGSKWVRIKDIKPTEPYPFPREGPHNVSMEALPRSNISINKYTVTNSVWTLLIVLLTL